MPSERAIIPLNNYVQNGDQTLGELLASIGGATGTRPGVADLIRDPATGRLVRVELTFPDTVSAQAIAAINANAGVPTTVVPIPQQLFISDLDDVVGIQAPGSNPGNKGHAVSGAVITDVQLKAIFLGGYNTSSGVFAYEDGDENPLYGGLPFVISFSNSRHQEELDLADFTVANNQFNIKAAGAASALLLKVATVGGYTIPSLGIRRGDNADVVYVDTAGKMYLAVQLRDGMPLSDPLSFVEAVGRGAI